MPAPYSVDLRKRVVEAYSSGKGSIRDIAKMFSIGKSSVSTYLKLQQDNGNLKPKKASGGQSPVIGDKGKAFILKQVEKKADITLLELCDKYFNRFKVKVNDSMMCRALQQLNLRRKKKSLYAAEQDREDIKKKNGI